jgi:hypothetical protein
MTRFAVTSRPMVPDYQQAHSETHLANEAEKLDYFHCERGIDMDYLSVKIYHSHGEESPVQRNFADKFPISVSEESLVSFAYIDERKIAMPAFETHLARCARLFTAIERFQLVFVAIKEHQLSWSDPDLGLKLVLSCHVLQPMVDLIVRKRGHVRRAALLMVMTMVWVTRQKIGLADDGGVGDGYHSGEGFRMDGQVFRSGPRLHWPSRKSSGTRQTVHRGF